MLLAVSNIAEYLAAMLSPSLQYGLAPSPHLLVLYYLSTISPDVSNPVAPDECGVR